MPFSPPSGEQVFYKVSGFYKSVKNATGICLFRRLKHLNKFTISGFAFFFELHFFLFLFF